MRIPIKDIGTGVVLRIALEVQYQAGFVLTEIAILDIIWPEMKNRTEKLKINIDAAKKRIINLFIEQCQNGAQAKPLEKFEATACGQFIGEQAKNSKQRGLHGTAAALNVLAQTKSQDIRPIVSKLIKYLAEREEIETDVQSDKDKARKKCQFDLENVIKISEIILALSFVDTGIHETEALVEKIASNLIQTMKEDKGWSYFIGDENGPELLPTAYAMLGLSAKSYSEGKKAADYISEKLERRYLGKNTIPDIDADIMIDVACLYALTFRKNHNNQTKQGENLRKIFCKIWEKQKVSLAEDLEQNVEYSYMKQKYCYIRVPSQLYLIALSTYYNFNWAFSSSIVQTKLQKSLEKVTSDGFIYPHSGREISARTNTILFEVLTIIEQKLNHKELFLWGNVRSKVMDILRFKPTRIIAGIILLLSSIFIVWRWYSTGNIQELGPGLIGAAWIFLLTITFKKF